MQTFALAYLPARVISPTRTSCLLMSTTLILPKITLLTAIHARVSNHNAIVNNLAILGHTKRFRVCI